jgi:ABC-type nickel/cobalt efflux system permease component RcnA
MKSITWVGAVIVLLGMLGLAIPVFTTSRTENLAQVGSVKIQDTEQSMHVIPQILSAGVLVLGLLMIGAGLYPKGAQALGR